MILRRNRNPQGNSSADANQICAAGKEDTTTTPHKANQNADATHCSDDDTSASSSAPASPTPSRVDQKQRVGVPEQQQQQQQQPNRKPFFIMDWLDQIDPADLQLAQKMLQTPKQAQTTNKKGVTALFQNTVWSPTSVIPRQAASDVQPRHLFQAEGRSTTGRDCPSSTAAVTSTLSSSASSASSQAAAQTAASSSAASSYYRRRSIAIGNGWNAKGLQKAKAGLWHDALVCWKNALQVRTQVLGDTHVDVANTYNNLGIAHGKLQQPAVALNMLHRALQIRQRQQQQQAQAQQKAQDDDSPSNKDHAQQVAATVHNIGNVLQQCGEFEAAIHYFWRAKQLQQELLASSSSSSTTTTSGKHTNNNNTTNNVQIARAELAMGHAYYQCQRYPEAHRAYCQAISIFQVLQDEQDQQQEHQRGRAKYYNNNNNNNKGMPEDDEQEEEEVVDYSAEIEATWADVQELNMLIHQAASKTTS